MQYRNSLFLAFLIITQNGCSSSEWGLSQWMRGLKFRNDAVVAKIGLVPIYQSDMQVVLSSLPLEDQKKIRSQKDGRMLIDLTIDRFLLRKAAIERGIEKSPYIAAQLSNVENQIYADWMKNYLLIHNELRVTDAEVTDFENTHPEVFEKRQYIEYTVDRYTYDVLSSRKLSTPKSYKLLNRQTATANYSAHSPLTGPLRAIVDYAVGKSSGFIPCGSDLCRYTKTASGIIPTGSVAFQHKLAEDLILNAKEKPWIQHQKESQSISINNNTLESVFEN